MGLSALEMEPEVRQGQLDQKRGTPSSSRRSIDGRLSGKEDAVMDAVQERGLRSGINLQAPMIAASKQAQHNGRPWAKVEAIELTAPAGASDVAEG